MAKTENDGGEGHRKRVIDEKYTIPIGFAIGLSMAIITTASAYFNVPSSPSGKRGDGLN